MTDKTEMILKNGAQDVETQDFASLPSGKTMSPDSATRAGDTNDEASREDRVKKSEDRGESKGETQNFASLQQPDSGTPPPLPPRNNGESFTYKYQYEAPKRAGCGRSCLQMLAVFVAGVLGLSLLMSSCTSVFEEAVKESMKTAGARHASGEFSSLTEETLSGYNASNKVLRLAVSGMISLDDASSGWGSEESGSAHALRSIRKATGDRDVRGILLQVNSGGGGVTASDIIWNALEEFKKARYGRFVVVLMGDTAASGAYYISAGADCIVAHPTTLTGSIGVIVNSYNVRELAEKIGLKSVTIKSGANKSMLSPFEDMSPEQEAMLQKIVDALHTRFVGIVAEGRGLDVAKVKNIADGRVLLADEALAHGLIDKIGYLADAKSEVEKKLGGEEPQYITYTRQGGFFRVFMSPSFWGKAFSAAVKETAAETGAVAESPEYERIYK